MTSERRGDDAASAARKSGSGAMRWALALLGLLGVVVAFWVHPSPVMGGGRTLQGFCAAQAGLAFLVAAGGIGRAASRAVLLAALFLLATAAQLFLTSPLWLQVLDLRPARLAESLPLSAVAVAVLLLQGLVVLALAFSRRRAFGSFLRAAATPLRLAVALVAFLLCAAHASPLFREEGARHILPFVALVGVTAVLVCVNVVHVALCVEALPAGALGRLRDRLASAISLPGEDRPPTSADRALPWIAAAGVTAVAAFFAVAVFDRVPHIPDEIAYVFQARCLAAGEVSAPAPPVQEAFGDYCLDARDGRWFATTNPGFAVALAPAAALGVPWLLNPLLAGLGVLLLHGVVRRWSDRGTAHLATLLLAVSPWYLWLGASWMTHTLTFVLLLVAWRLLGQGAADSKTSHLAAAGAGLALGFLVLVRPLDGLVAGAFTGLWWLVSARPRLAPLACYALGCVAGAIWLLPFNAALTGHFLTDPMNDYLDRLWYPGANRLGFGADVGNVPGQWGGLDPRRGHGAIDVLLNSNQNLYNLNFDLFGWAVGSLLLAVVHATLGTWRALDRWLAAFAVGAVAALSVYWFSGGPDFGARYWFLVLVPCLWFTVRGAGTLAAFLRERCSVADAPTRVGAAMALLAAVTLVTFLPWRASAKYADYRGFHGDYRRMAASGLLGRSLVLVKATTTADASSALALNPPTLDPDGPLFARDLGPGAERRLTYAFPDRPVVHVLGRSVTGGAARIVEGSR